MYVQGAPKNVRTPHNVECAFTKITFKVLFRRFWDIFGHFWGILIFRSNAAAQQLFFIYIYMHVWCSSCANFLRLNVPLWCYIGRILAKIVKWGYNQILLQTLLIRFGTYFTICAHLGGQFFRICSLFFRSHFGHAGRYRPTFFTDPLPLTKTHQV